MGAAAFFDVDNTLIQGSSLVVFAIGLFRKKYFRFSEILPIAWKQLKFRITGSENAADVAEGRNQALSFIEGKRVDELIELCEDIVDSSMIDKAWPATRELARMHLAAGPRCGSCRDPGAVAQIRRSASVSPVPGPPWPRSRTVVHGRLVGDILHGPGKKHSVAALAAIEQLDLARCTAYSDSINDIPMLSMVAPPVAITRTRNCARAAQRGWRSAITAASAALCAPGVLPAVVTAAATWAAGGCSARTPRISRGNAGGRGRIPEGRRPTASGVQEIYLPSLRR